MLEALHAGLPVRTAYVAEGAEHDSRLRAILTFCADHGIALMQATRGELDRMTGGSNHQGVALRLPEYEYATVGDLIAACLLYTSPSPRDQRGSRMPSSA